MVNSDKFSEETNKNEDMTSVEKQGRQGEQKREQTCDESSEDQFTRLAKRVAEDH